MKNHGNTIIEIVPCGIHPLHLVKVRTNGTRSGCPMCEMQIEDLGRSLTPQPKSEHSPLVNLPPTMIIGCTCGWRTPSCVTDSDEAFSYHVAMMRAAEGKP